jgi:hypothetical protein
MACFELVVVDADNLTYRRPSHHPPPTPPNPIEQGTGFLHRTLKKLTSERDDLIARIVPYFTRTLVPAGTTLWRRNDPSSFACIVEKGACVCACRKLGGGGAGGGGFFD